MNKTKSKKTKPKWKGVPVGKLCWHIHHAVLLEISTEPLNNRANYIKSDKPKEEREIRLNLMKPVLHPEKLPKELVTAHAAHDKADIAWANAGIAHDKANVTYDKSHAAYDKADIVWAKANVTYDKSHAAYDKANVAYDKANAKYTKKIEALHREECPNCPWDGRSIFSYR